MIYIFYNSASGEVLGAYHESCYPNIPEPNITITDEVWNRVHVENRTYSVNVNTKQFVIGDVRPTPKRTQRYSKLLIIRKLKSVPVNGVAVNMWDNVKTYIEENGYMDEWDACTYLADDDEMFLAVMNTLKQQYPSVDWDGMLAECKY